MIAQSEAVLTHLMRDGETDPKKLASGIEHYAGIERERIRIAREKAVDKAFYESRLKALAESLDTARKSCDHPYTEHITGAMSSDNYTVCYICGAQFD